MNEMYDHIEKYLSKEVRTDIRLLISDFTILKSTVELTMSRMQVWQS